MALRWDFKCKAGTVTEVHDGHEFVRNFYEGNALMIVTHEYEKDGETWYDMAWFFVGEEHAKNCLGLTKGHDNMFGENGISRLTIYRKYCHEWLRIVKLFTKAFPHITIELRDTAPEEKEA